MSSMINRLLLSCLSTMALATIAFAGDFEGEIHTSMTVAGQPRSFDSVLFVKGDNTRQEGQYDGRKFVSIYDARRRVVIMPNLESKTYVEWALDKEEAAAHPTEKMYVFERTGKTETIAGYACDNILVKEKDTGTVKSEVCVHKGLGGITWRGMDRSKGGQTMRSWMKDLLKDGGFPLRITTKKPDGAQEMRMEVTRVEKKWLSDSLFSIPAGYTKVEMGSMMGGGAGRPGGTGAASQGNEDVEKMMRDAQKRKAEESGVAGGEKESGQQSVNELMKNLGEMMKKQQGGQ